MPDLSELPGSYKDISEKKEGMVPLLPDLSSEQLRGLSFARAHQIVSRRIHEQQLKFHDRRRQIWQMGVLAFGPLVLPPDYLLKDRESEAKTEDVMLAVGVREALARAIFIGGGADADPRFSQIIVSMLKFVTDYTKAHQGDVTGRNLNRWMNGLNAEVAVDKALFGPFDVYSPSVERSARRAFTQDAKKKIDRVVIKDKTVFLPDIKGDFFLPEPFYDVQIDPDPVTLSRKTLDLLGRQEGLAVREILQDGGKIFRMNLLVSTDPKHLSELDFSLESPAAILRAYARLGKETESGIIQDIERWIKENGNDY